MADVAREIKDVSFAANKLANEFQIAAVALYEFNILLYGFNVEKIPAARRVQGIEYCDGGAELSEANSETASDETETAGD